MKQQAYPPGNGKPAQKQDGGRWTLLQTTWKRRAPTLPKDDYINQGYGGYCATAAGLEVNFTSLSAAPGLGAPQRTFYSTLMNILIEIPCNNIYEPSFLMKMIQHSCATV